MMIYKNGKTNQVISHLISLATMLNRMTIAVWVFVFGILVTNAVAFFARDYWWLGGIFGILLGFGFGIFFASVLNLAIEWMVQVLIAQSEVLNRLNKFHDHPEASIPEIPSELTSSKTT